MNAAQSSFLTQKKLARRGNPPITPSRGKQSFSFVSALRQPNWRHGEIPVRNAVFPKGISEVWNARFGRQTLDRPGLPVSELQTAWIGSRNYCNYKMQMRVVGRKS